LFFTSLFAREIRRNPESALDENRTILITKSLQAISGEQIKAAVAQILTGHHFYKY
jgi:hypothetical protein